MNNIFNNSAVKAKLCYIYALFFGIQLAFCFPILPEISNSAIAKTSRLHRNARRAQMAQVDKERVDKATEKPAHLLLQASSEQTVRMSDSSIKPTQLAVDAPHYVLFAHDFQYAPSQAAHVPEGNKQSFWPLEKQQAKKNIKPSSLEMPIRVLVEEQPIKKIDWCLESSQGFVLYNSAAIHNQSYSPKIVITVKSIGAQPYIFLNGKKQLEKTMYIKPRNSSISFKGNVYKGAMVVFLLDKTLYLINHISLEEYVASVLPHESWPGWSDEVNRAMSIVIRTYGIFKLLEERKSRQRKSVIMPYDIKSTNLHQTYKGIKDHEKYSRIVAETKGLILSYKDAPILAMFDACCGGVIPSRISGIDFDKAPYLRRTYPCHHCKDCKAYKWQEKFTLLEMENTLKKEFKKVTRLREMRIIQADEAGLVQKIKIRIPAIHEMTGKKCKALFKKLKSRCFAFEKQGQQYIFTGSGLGHHIGMCQWGAHALVAQGWKHQDVLKFYYPGATLMKLKTVVAGN